MDARLRRCVGFGAVAWMALGVRAQQVDVSLTLAYSVYVVGEPVLVQMECLNATRDRIEISGAGASASLFVEISSGSRFDELEPFNRAPMVRELRLNPGQSFQQKVELDKWFGLTREGRYIARLVLVHGGVRYLSAKRSFDIVPGLPVTEGVQMFVSRANTKRQFKLVYWHRNQNDRLFLRATDEPSGRVWDAVDLGTFLRREPPKFDISPEGEVTVVHRSTRDAFIRTVFWSLPDSLEVAERNSLLDPDISASQRLKALYSESEGAKAGDKDGKEEKAKKAWWKFW